MFANECRLRQHLFWKPALTQKPETFPDRRDLIFAKLTSMLAERLAVTCLAELVMLPKFRRYDMTHSDESKPLSTSQVATLLLAELELDDLLRPIVEQRVSGSATRRHCEYRLRSLRDALPKVSVAMIEEVRLLRERLGGISFLV
jgi:hypothetical protein